MSKRESALGELAKQVPIKELYIDLLHPALSEAGKGLQGVVHLALAPISGMVWCYDQISDYLNVAIPEYFAKKKIPNEKIQEPDAAIAVPTIEALRYTANEEVIREFFVNLLGASMNSDTTSLVHPAFVEIVKQLSVSDAKCLIYLKSYRKALIDFEVRIDNRYTYVGSNAIDVPKEFKSNITSHINNFIRLGIFEKVKTTRLSCPSEFKVVEEEIKTNAVLTYSEDAESVEVKNIDLSAEYYWLSLTNFGEDFVSICC
ncbi:MULTISPECIES: DUF4393 domain-containing protein [Caproicibacterium]|uniref:DUF4393 domain-containing protein n=1 Tax=Caproicibacterium argilliputei TaxID=3030016 RepID=A0AA97DDM2_9FIRM|nr:DUF4393 domain-containing protein [Caproicibacterium argilliputei]WOC33501.1 DUF4393 domain-containing protein [Caproicibacterium argilliputei]